MMFKQQIKEVFNRFGFDISNINNVPEYTLLGIRDLPINTVLDIGANIGQFARYITKIFPNASLYCFEPLPGPYGELVKWSEGTDPARINTYNIALGDKKGNMDINLHLDHTPSSSLLESTELNHTYYPQTQNKQKITVGINTLDSLYEENILGNLEDGVLIKMDVQGFEDRVIRGGKNTFKNAMACIVEISLDGLYSEQAKFNDLVEIFNDLNFSYAGNMAQVYGKDGHVIFLDAVFKRNN